MRSEGELRGEILKRVYWEGALVVLAREAFMSELH